KNLLGDKLNIGANIKDVFQQWEIDDDINVIKEKINEKRFNFIISSIAESDHILLTGIKVSDFSHLEKENEALKSLNRDLMAAIENSYDAIYITDRQGKTLLTNSAIERISGIPKEYYIGKSIDSLVERGILKSSITHPVVKQK